MSVSERDKIHATDTFWIRMRIEEEEEEGEEIKKEKKRVSQCRIRG